MAVSKRLRFEVLRRDNHACRYCGGTAPDVTLTVDHVVPKTLGGADEPSNLVAACKDCNAGKSSVPAGASLVDEVAGDALRWAQAMAVVAQERAEARAATGVRHDEFRAHWNTWTYSYRGERCTVDLPGSWGADIDQFLTAGLEMADLHELTDVAMASKAHDTWKYFCGCCWRRLEQNRERAAEIVSSGQTTEPDRSEWLYSTWTIEEFRSTVATYEGFAQSHLTPEEIASFGCRHQPFGPESCPDPLCQIERLILLNSEIDRRVWAFLREDGLMNKLDALDEADELEAANG